jgi:hypothetical protein
MGHWVNGEYQPNKAGVFALCLTAFLLYWAYVEPRHLGLIGLYLFVCVVATFLAWVGVWE